MDAGAVSAAAVNKTGTLPCRQRATRRATRSCGPAVDTVYKPNGAATTSRADELQGIAPLPVTIREAEYLLSIGKRNGTTYDCRWHQLRANRVLVPVVQDDVLEQFAQHLVADIETAFL